MAKLPEMLEYVDSHLEVASFSDLSLNGLQVEGRREVQRVALGVSASLRLFEKAIEWGAEAIIVHHGLLWGGQVRIVGPFARRIRSLLDAEVSLLAYHLPLDAHPDDGNNAVLARRFGLVKVKPWGSYHGKAIGVMGETEGAQEQRRFIELVAETCESTPQVLGGGEASIRSVAICSGGGGSLLEQAIESGADVLVTGEPGEPALQLAQETDTMVIGAGHYNTERFGVQALGARLANTFDVTVKFFEIPNPI